MQAQVDHAWKLQDGKVVAFEQFTDTLRVRQAMS
jgi:ketosteroid isomerase-like protein